jgi:hypothetical protein
VPFERFRRVEVDDGQVAVCADGVPSAVAVMVAAGEITDDVHGFHRVCRTKRINDEVAFFVGAVGDLVRDLEDSPTLLSYVPAPTQLTGMPPGSIQPSAHCQNRT